MPPAIQHPSGASASSNAPPLAYKEAQMLPAMENYNQRLTSYVASRQYESSILPGKQFGLDLPPSPFSARQQQQSRYDGQYEADNTTTRELVPIVDEEPGAHIAREARRAAADSRPSANAYSHVPLTGNVQCVTMEGHFAKWNSFLLNGFLLKCRYREISSRYR